MRVDQEIKMLNEVRAIFDSCGFVDGIGKTEEEIKNETATMYWTTILENSAASKKDSYIVYSVEPEQENIYGDGKNLIARLGCRIDLFMVYPVESRNTYEFRKTLEEAFEKFDTWSLEFNLSLYDEQVKLNQFSYTAYKIYG